MNETEIIKKLQQGSEPAFKLLVETYQKLVVNTCFGLVQNTEDAEDIAQEVFVEVFRSIQNFRADAKLSTWLYRIAVNRSFNHLRDNKKRRCFQSFDDVVKEKNAQLQHQASANPGIELENLQRVNILHEANNTGYFLFDAAKQNKTYQPDKPVVWHYFNPCSPFPPDSIVWH